MLWLQLQKLRFDKAVPTDDKKSIQFPVPQGKKHNKFTTYIRQAQAMCLSHKQYDPGIYSLSALESRHSLNSSGPEKTHQSQNRSWPVLLCYFITASILCYLVVTEPWLPAECNFYWASLVSWTDFQNIWRESSRGPCAHGLKQHLQIQFQQQSHYSYYTSLKTQLPSQAYLRVKE